MALLYNFGNTLVTEAEVAEKAHLGDFNDFMKVAAFNDNAKIEFRSGTVHLPQLFDNRSLGLPSFTPIGIGEPLSVEILCVYTGDAPQTFFGGRKDLLVVSGVKGVQTHGEAPRAINQMEEKIGDNQYLQPGAFTQGSPIAYYTPAVDISSTFCSFELISDSFKEETFNMVARLFSTASSLPVFAPQGMYLMAGSMIVRMAADLGSALLESAPFLKGTIPFRFDTPDVPISRAKQLVICNERDTQKLLGYAPGLIRDGNGNQRPALMDKATGRRYEGNAPYIIVSIDGRTRPELEDFAPRLASAALLEKFYGQQREEQVVDVLDTAMRLYNDYNYHKKAVDLQQRMSLLDPTSEEFLKKEKLLRAYLKNIQLELFQVADR